MALQFKNSKKAHEFIGLCLGILADNKLVKAEVEFLRDWLRKNPKVAGTYPVKGLFIRLCEMLEDEVIDEEEEKELFEHLFELTDSGKKKKKSSLDTLADKVMLPSFTEPVPSIKFTESRFFLHGQFIIGTTEWLSTQVKEKGGVIVDDLCDQTDYCIIGAMAEIEPSATPDLVRKLSDYSRKKLKIIAEEHWVNLLF